MAGAVNEGQRDSARTTPEDRAGGDRSGRGRHDGEPRSPERPLRPLALGWAAFGILPWVIAAALFPAAPYLKLASVFHTLTLLAVIFAVKDRVPVRAGRTATGASLVLFLLAVVRFGLLPFGEGLFIDPASAGELGDDLLRMILYVRFLELGFHVTTVVLLASVAPALVRRWRGG